MRHMTVINFQELPPTLRDAIIVTEQMGLEYLWVDALCIIQDDDEDRAREIESMGLVYESANFTIAASRAEAASEGFLHDLIPYGHASPQWVFRMKCRTGVTGEVGDITLVPKYRRGTIDHLSKRAWAYQEKMFSNRVFEYGAACVHWTCLEANECDRAGGKCKLTPPDKEVIVPRNLEGTHKALALKSWYKTINIITEKALTLPSDRLPAISGIAEQYGRLLKDDYLAGIWRSSLPRGLLWIADSWKSKHDNLIPLNPNAPSWSWASINKATNSNLYTIGESRSVIEAEVVDVEIKHQTQGARYGPTESGRLTLRSFLTPMNWKMPAADGWAGSSGSFSRSFPSWAAPDLSAAIQADSMGTGVLVRDGRTIRVYLLALVRTKSKDNVVGLILHQHDDGTYARLGCFDIPGCPADIKAHPTMAGWFLQGERQEVTVL